MNPTPPTRPRYALRWVLGVGLVFVVVVGMALQVARSRAEERWESVMTRWNQVMAWNLASGTWEATRNQLYAQQRARGGNMFRAWRQREWEFQGFSLVVRQEGEFFGSDIAAHMSGGEPEEVDAMRAFFAAVDVELVVDP